MQVTVRAGLEVEDWKRLDNLMRVYQSALRFAYNRLLEGKFSDNDIVKLLRSIFGINSRYAYSALVEAKEIISSQKRLLRLHIEEIERKIEKSKRKLARVKNPLKRKGIGARIKKLERKKKEYERHLSEGTTPKIIFGGRRNFELLKKGKLSKEEWRELRSNQVYCIGGQVINGSRVVTNGNYNLQLIHIEGNRFRLRINVGYKEFIEGEIEIDSPYLFYLLRHLEEKKAYSVRIIRKGRRYEAHITFNVEKEIEPNGKGVAGIDINPDGIAVTIAYPDGNFKVSKWFYCPELTYVSSNKRDWLIGNLVKEVILWIKSFGINTIAMEDLKFKNDLDTNRRFNRIVSNFTRAKIKQNILTRCLREDVAVIFVNPAYTSIIGQLKYARMYELNSHQAAAYVIARRALGYGERIPKFLSSFASPREKSLSVWKRLWRKVKPMEGGDFPQALQMLKDRVANSGSGLCLLKGGPKGSDRRVRVPPPTGDTVKPGPPQGWSGSESYGPYEGV